MVDGLSGAVAVLLLVCVVFMISSAGAFLSQEYRHIFVKNPNFDYREQVIKFNGVIDLNLDKVNFNKNVICKNIEVEFFYPSSVGNFKEKAIYNFISLKKQLKETHSVSMNKTINQGNFEEEHVKWQCI